MDNQSYVLLLNETKPFTKKLYVTVCDGFFTKFRGLMFRKTLDHEEGILLTETSDSVINSSIHMIFMNFNIAVIWLNSSLVVVDKTIARKGFRFYFPQKPSMYTLEIHPDRIEDFNIGDKVLMKNA